VIHAEDIRKSFGRIKAVDGVSFEVRRSQIYGLLGPNGAGKTTTISMLSGVLKPDGGRVQIDGDGDPSRPRTRLKLGNAPQALALYDELTAEENLAFFGRLYGLRGRTLKVRVGWCLEFAQLTERRNSRVGTFSGGMKRRLNLACGLIHEPLILLLDEPTVGVDPQSRNVIFESIEQLRGEGLTVIYTTHYMEEAQRLCDVVAIIDHGKLLAEDSVSALIEAHGGKAVVRADLERVPEDTSALPGDVYEGVLKFETERPLEEVAQLNSKGIVFRSLRIDRPDLESVFLNLTGRRLRD